LLINSSFLDKLAAASRYGFSGKGRLRRPSIPAESCPQPSQTNQYPHGTHDHAHGRALVGLGDTIRQGSRGRCCARERYLRRGHYRDKGGRAAGDRDIHGGIRYRSKDMPGVVSYPGGHHPCGIGPSFSLNRPNFQLSFRSAVDDFRLKRALQPGKRLIRFRIGDQQIETVTWPWIAGSFLNPISTM
jgi:hypothetical protein